MQISSMQLHHLMQCVEQLYQTTNADALCQAVLEWVPRVVQSDCTGYTEVNVKQQRVTAVMDRDSCDLVAIGPILFAHRAQHPLITRFEQTRDGQALMVSDFLSASEFEQTPLYNDVYRQMDVQEQMSIGLPTGATSFVGICVNRARRTFSETDRMLMNLLRPHVWQAYANAMRFAELGDVSTLLSEALDDLNAAVVRVQDDGRYISITGRGQAWLAKHFPDHTASARLPQRILTWLRRETATAICDTLPAARLPFISDMAGDRLEIRRLPHKQDGAHILLLKRSTTFTDPSPLQRLGLTQREAETLFWVAQGKTNPEVSVILAISPRTVQKHMERILSKLHVETRTAAAMRAVEVLREFADNSAVH